MLALSWMSQDVACGIYLWMAADRVIRNSFKDLAALDDLSDLLTQPDAQISLAIDMGGGVVLFGLVALFYLVAGRRSAYQASLRAPTPALVRFIERKKAVSLILTIVLRYW